MSWKYGTILEDTVYDRKLMVVREIPVDQAGEKGLYDAIDLADDGSGERHAVSPNDAGIHEVRPPGLVFTYEGGDVIGSGTFSGAVTFDDPPDVDAESFTISWGADGVYKIT